VSLVLRNAHASDVGTILGFIRELAEYEKLAHEVVADEGSLVTHLFGDRPSAHVVIAEWHGEPAGFALYFYSFSTFLAKPTLYLEDLFVRPLLRGNGIGDALLRSLAAVALERGCGRMEWSVLDWNEPALGFYRKLGASPMNDWTVHRLTGASLEACARGAKKPA
jgi:GNAT superfamily N-acetyltransferase